MRGRRRSIIDWHVAAIDMGSKLQVFETVGQIQDSIFERRQVDVFHRRNGLRTGGTSDSRLSLDNLILLLDLCENFVLICLHYEAAKK